ncbi:MAG: RdgB/HAM1 family non-canonical purine NTP pyrophosphatase [Bacteroidetes bacterium]|nr:RdgB/HAM1 family non-canonical purine NTP pyrophosphatase [Bacteroidota bacterium]MBS1974773.1 RdgB/HAM1 family non-canonical purine NTP pyrophosphatase [Bacteroidota bacterium]
MTKLIFATNNQHKVDEIQSAISNSIEVVSLKEAGIDIDIPEPHDTLEANASEKSGTIHQLTKMNCFSEDTGLEVEALNGEPGVKSARYAGEDKSFDKNIDKLLSKLGSNQNRKARFRTVISLILDHKEHLFEGICEGKILMAEKGEKGFGYDPVFMPEGSNKSFAEMSIDEKSKFSHRKKAVDKMTAFLKTRFYAT